MNGGTLISHRVHLASTLTDYRNFLLFIPANAPNLRAVLSYYSSTVTVNAEGDVHISDDAVEGLGKHHFLTTMFGAAPRMLQPLYPSTVPPRTSIPSPSQQPSIQDQNKSKESTFPWDPGEFDVVEDRSFDSTIVLHNHRTPSKAELLTDLLPDPGYFIAGGVAGVVSRTATAPLDRLKVYLIAQVGVKDDALQAAKSGSPIKAATTAAKPLIEASRTLWRMGGMRSLFAGNYIPVSSRKTQLMMQAMDSTY